MNIDIAVLMNCSKLGPVLNFIGTLAVGLSSQFGTDSAWGGSIAWKTVHWRIANGVGWILLATGFALEICK